MNTLGTLKAVGFVDGDVVTYTPKDTWCHHGIAIVHIEDGRTRATDTYWGAYPTDNSYVDIERLDPENIIGNLHTFSVNIKYPNQFADFKESDKFYIPMGGSGAQYWVRISAVPVPSLVRARYMSAVEDAESAVRSANWKLEWANKELAAFDEAIARLEAK